MLRLYMLYVHTADYIFMLFMKKHLSFRSQLHVTLFSSRHNSARAGAAAKKL